MKPEYSDGPAKYYLDDLPGASIPASRLHSILQRVQSGQPLSAIQQEFLKKSGLIALLRFSLGSLGHNDFEALGSAEREKRVAEDAAARKAHEEKRRMETEITEKKNVELFARLEKKRARRKLFDNFGMPYVEQGDLGRLRRILRQVSDGTAINEVDLAWLAEDRREYWTEALSRTHHEIMAKELTRKWQNTRDPWKAVTACAHWRKAQRARDGLEVVGEALARQMPPNVRSALLTTSGGTLRDLNRREEALDRGLQTHALCPDNFRHCTLLGAVHIENHSYAEGVEWYVKADVRGAKRDMIDREIHSLVSAARPEHREKIRQALKAHDSCRFDAF